MHRAPFTIFAALAIATAAGVTPVSAASTPKKAAARPPVLPFIHDDYTKALTEARASKRPIFIEAWAPW